MSADSLPTDQQNVDASAVTQSLREAKWIMVIWFLSSLWTIGYCWLYSYEPIDPTRIQTVFGLPSWVFWGVAVPWLLTTLVSILFAIWGIQEDDLRSEIQAEIKIHKTLEQVTNIEVDRPLDHTKPFDGGE